MKRKQLKFVIGILAILGTILYLSFAGLNENMAHHYTIAELKAVRQTIVGQVVRVVGQIVPGTIHRADSLVAFTIQDPKGTGDVLNIRYIGHEPLPDTFLDRAEATVSGEYGRDGVFMGTSVLICERCAVPVR